MTSAAIKPFKIYGPFDLPKGPIAAKKGVFASSAEKLDPLLPYAWGVYVLGLRFGASYRVTYIGKTTSRDGFYFEIFAGDHKKSIWAAMDQMRGKQVAWLLAKPKSGKRGFCWDSRVNGFAMLTETLMILHAEAAGHQTLNKSKKLLSAAISVEGLFGPTSSRKLAGGAAALRDAIF